MHSALPTSKNELFIQAVQVYASVQLKHGASQFWHIPFFEYIWAGHYEKHYPKYWAELFLHRIQDVLFSHVRHVIRHVLHIF
jgi:hypothetical protein